MGKVRKDKRGKKKSKKRKNPKREKAGARKGRKVAQHRFFLMFWGSGGLKSRLAKAAGAEPSGQMSDEKLHAVVAQSRSRSQNAKNCGLGAPLDVEIMKNCTALLLETHFGIKLVKALNARHTFGS